MKVSKLLLVFLIPVLLIFAGCQTTNTEMQKDTLQGTVRVSGAFALYPMMLKWAEEFQKVNPGVRIDVSAGGAGKGAADALGGLVDLGMISRSIKQEEIDQGAYFVPVVKDAVFPAVNEKNPALNELLQKGIKKQVFIDLWINDKAMTWGEVAGASSTQKVVVYTRSDSCGAAETWAKYLKTGGLQEDLKGVGVYADPGIAEAVVKDALGIGYNNLNYAYDAKTGLPVAGMKVVPIDINENGIVDENEKLDSKQMAIGSVRNGVYPSPPARDLNLMTKGNFTGVTKEFVKWILTDGQNYVEETGYIKLTPMQIEDALKKV